MYMKKTIASRIVAFTMAIAMALTMGVSAFAVEYQPYNADDTTIKGNVSATAQTYSVTVTAPSDTTQIKMEATLYQKQLIGRKEISSMTGSTYTWKCTKSQSAAIEKGKTYVIEVTAQVYSGGAWDTVEETITVKT